MREKNKMLILKSFFFPISSHQLTHKDLLEHDKVDHSLSHSFKFNTQNSKSSKENQLSTPKLKWTFVQKAKENKKQKRIKWRRI